jgi:2-amino-4-hydroxy-6-hydroxymethyldihydropteridine diphosphokinase
MSDRAFVLLPLAEIAADWIHPIAGVEIGKLAKNPLDLDLSYPIAIANECFRDQTIDT